MQLLTGYTLFQNPLFFPRDCSGGAKPEIDDSVCRIKKKVYSLSVPWEVEGFTMTFYDYYKDLQ
jgi:hypothetical protein